MLGVKHMKEIATLIAIFALMSKAHALDITFPWVKPEAAYAHGKAVVIAKVVSARMTEENRVLSKVKVIEALKSSNKGQEITIYYGPEEVGAKYVLLLTESKSSKAEYDLWHGQNTKIKVGSVEAEDLDIYNDALERRGVSGKGVISPQGFYYLPLSCNQIESQCQREFEFVQVLLNKASNPTP